MKIIEINREPVELYKVLKFEGLASSGGEAKQWIADERVEVNGIQDFVGQSCPAPGQLPVERSRKDVQLLQLCLLEGD